MATQKKPMYWSIYLGLLLQDSHVILIHSLQLLEPNISTFRIQAHHLNSVSSCHIRIPCKANSTHFSRQQCFHTNAHKSRLVPYCPLMVYLLSIFIFLLQVTELECVSSQANAVHTHKTELNQTIQELEATLKKKEEVFVSFCFLTHKIAWKNMS